MSKKNESNLINEMGKIVKQNNVSSKEKEAIQSFGKKAENYLDCKYGG